MSPLESVFQHIDAGLEQSTARLCDFLRIPSVSTRPENAADVHRCAEWLAAQIRQRGLWARVEPTGGHPVVLAGNEPRPGRPTVLLYGHYDVQPPDPLEQWTTPPFEPSIRDDAVYARGAADDKGQVWAHVEAIGALQNQGGLPVNLILVIEGEEEIGSDHLLPFLEQHRSELKADIAVISDTNQFARGLPAITYGLRGLVYLELTVIGPSHDLHSGMYGGAVPNPANVLAQLLATLHTKSGKVNIPGFYDDVRPLARSERTAWKRLPFEESTFTRDLGLAGLQGEASFSTLERKWARPTCDINGLTSGYQGPGAKTIIPARASAKVSMRLVPDQDPQKVRDAFEAAIRQRCPATVRVEVATHSLSGACIVPFKGRPMQLAIAAVEQGFGTRPVLIREGGSIPVVGQLKSILGIDTLLVGFGLPDDRVHSPNEKFDLDAFAKGIRTAAALYSQLAGL